MHLLFDFDGTLVDSYRCVIEKTILLADQFRLRKIKEEEIDSLKDLSSKEIIQHLNVPLYKIPQLIYAMRNLLRLEMQHLHAVPGIMPMVEKLHQAGFSLGILTSNSMENVNAWLDKYEASAFFKFIHCESSYFSKKYLLKKILNKYRLDKANTFYICDETRDVHAATTCGISSIAVTWGYNSEKALLNYQPTHIAHQPADLLTLCAMPLSTA